MTTDYGDVSWERMIGAVEKVRARLLRATAALDRATVPYAVVGGNAVMAWVSRVDEAAIRNTQDVDILLRRSDLDAVKQALAAAGFIHRRVNNFDFFLDGEHGKDRDAVHVVFADEKVRADHAMPAPSITEAERTPEFQLLSLEPLVRMMLTSFATEDQMNLRDLLDVGLIDATWPRRFLSPLVERLQELIDDPE